MFGKNDYVGKLLKQSLPSLPADFVKTQIVGRFKAIPPTILIQVDIDPYEIGKNYPAEVGITGDAKSVLTSG